MALALALSIGVFFMAMLVSAALYVRWNQRETVMAWRMRVESEPWLADVPPDNGRIVWLTDRVKGLLERLGQANKPKDDGEIGALRQSMITAGYRHENAALLFLGGKLFCAIAALLTAVAIPTKLLGFPTSTQLVTLYVAAAFIGYYLPTVWLRLIIARRKEKLLHAVPDALDLMVVCVEAGLGLDMAIARVGDEIKFAHKELGEEFHLLALELRTGVARIDALRNLARRTDLEEIKTLVALLVQTDRFGTSIGQALRVHSDSMKVARQMRAEELAAKLPVKLLFPLIFFIFPSLFIVILGPAVIRVIRVLLPSLGAH